MQQTNLALRDLPGNLLNSFKSLCKFFLSSASAPAYLAEKMPGAPPSASTSSPESSATAGHPVKRATATAFFSALALKVFPSSTTSGQPGNSSRGRNLTPSPAKSLVNSSVFFLFLVARAIFIFTKQTTIYTSRGFVKRKRGDHDKLLEEHLFIIRFIYAAPLNNGDPWLLFIYCERYPSCIHGEHSLCTQ